MWKSHTALIARWGDSLAIHLPAELAKALELRVGDEIEFIVDEPCGLEARREFDVDGLLQQLRYFRGKLPADFRFSRDETRL